ncbi:MAG: NAD-dependent epimerase/dehydratase family protein [Planctomycetales bacterium]|nr:NAD-dependent epimerase/dehydratase family protein [Planctomycetales bacterium]
MTKTILVTGGFGCIGAETVKWLLHHSDADIVVCSRRADTERSLRVFHLADRSRLRLVEADVSQRPAIDRIFAEHPITHVAHLAALQTPDCNAHRDLGLQINLAGTQHLIESIKACGRALDRFVFASSIAVYGPRSAYPEPLVPMLADTRPVNVYGTWKLAGENLTRLLFEEAGIPAISLRPGVLFGPGRDAGLTSTPTTAMKCVTLGLAYEIPFRSRQDYLYAPDVGAAFGNALLEPFDGNAVFTLPSQTTDTETFVDTMRLAANDLGIGNQFKITVGNATVPFICDLDYQPFCESFPRVPRTDLRDAIRDSLLVFQDQVDRGWLTERNAVAGREPGAT